MNFQRRSAADLFAPFVEAGVSVAQHPEFRAMVADGMDPDTPVHLCGWVDDPNRIGLARTFAPPLAQAAPHLMGADQDVLLYKAWKEVLGSYPKYVAQQIGDCFAAGTMVRMEGGDFRPIDAISVGERVISHLGVPRRVSRVIDRPHIGEIVTLSLDGENPSVMATPDHLFWSSIINPETGDLDWGWKPIGEFEPGQVVSRMGGSMSGRVLTVKRSPYGGRVYCLEVEGDCSFIADGFDVHNCTSFGSSHSIDLLQCVEIFLLKEPTAFLELCTEAVYGMGREIGGMLGGGDGCYGVAVAKALTTMGATTRKLVGPYSGKRAKEWGRSGVPKEIKDAAAPFKVGSAALITTCDEMDAALANLYPAAGGFSQGFAMHRDQDGVCRQQGSWGHETCIVGRRTKNGQRQYCMAQSWGPNVPDGPTTDDQPDFTFWIDERAMASILGQNDFLTFSKAPDFEKRDVPTEFNYSRAVA